MNKFNIGDRVWFFYHFGGRLPDLERGIIHAIEKDEYDILYFIRDTKEKRYKCKECDVFLNETELKKACENLMRNKLAQLEEEKDWVKETVSSMVENIAKILEAESENKKKKQ